MVAADAKNALTASLEDYLETIYQLIQKNQFARVKDIAEARSVKPGSVSPALKRLSDMGLVRYERREYVGLTPEGEREARRVFARHQLLMRFFEEVLQMPAKSAEEQACVLEHQLSNEAMNQLVKFFEFLAVCPSTPPNFLEMFRGCPLVNGDGAGCLDAQQDESSLCSATCPTAGGRQVSESRAGASNIAELEPGHSGKVTHVQTKGAIRQRILDMGILPGVKVSVERVAPTGDPIWIRIQGTQLALRRMEAEAVRVVPV